MSHFAKVENGIVTSVIVAEQDFIDSGVVGDPKDWIQTSYNTYGNVHYTPNNSDRIPDGGVALRGNYASIGHVYDKVNDVFYEPQPYPSWTLDSNTWTWEAPIPRPNDTNTYMWDEEKQSWVEVPAL
jgi:hypothetical protein